MPISREEFEASKLDLAIPIRQILQANPDFAFSAEEVVERLTEVVGRNATGAEVAQKLGQLEANGDIDVADLGVRRWYIIVKEH